MQNKELTREQFPLSDSDFDIAVRDAMRCNNDPRWHKYLVAHDAALRARLAAVEQHLAAIQATVGDTEFALRARVAELEQRNTELEGDFLIASEQQRAERQQLATVTARLEHEVSRPSKLEDEIARLEAQMSSVQRTWTTAKPTVVGGYWVRSERLSPQIMMVEMILGVGLIVGPYMKPLDECDRWEFAGPIPLPKEGQQASGSSGGAANHYGAGA